MGGLICTVVVNMVRELVSGLVSYLGGLGGEGWDGN